MEENKKIYLGSCRSVHGLKGAFKLFLENSNSSILKSGMEIWILKDGSFQKKKITKISFGHKCMLFLEGISARSESEAFIPFEVYIDRSDLPQVDEDEYYLSDIIGFEAYGNGEGTPRGKIQKFYSNGVQDIAVIQGARPIEIPLVEPLLESIDFEEKKIFFNFPNEVFE